MFIAIDDHLKKSRRATCTYHGSLRVLQFVLVGETERRKRKKKRKKINYFLRLVPKDERYVSFNIVISEKHERKKEKERKRKMRWLK